MSPIELSWTAKKSWINYLVQSRYRNSAISWLVEQTRSKQNSRSEKKLKCSHFTVAKLERYTWPWNTFPSGQENGSGCCVFLSILEKTIWQFSEKVDCSITLYILHSVVEVVHSNAGCFGRTRFRHPAAGFSKLVKLIHKILWRTAWLLSFLTVFGQNYLHGFAIIYTSR